MKVNLLSYPSDSWIFSSYLTELPKYMLQISVCLHWQEGNYIIKLFTKLISVDTKLLRRCFDRMRYVLKHNDKKFFLCCYAYALTVAVTLIFQVIYTWHKDAYVYILMLLCPCSKPSCNVRVHYIIFSSLINVLLIETRLTRRLNYLPTYWFCENCLI